MCRAVSTRLIFGLSFMQIFRYLNAFKYACFDGFCETKLNQFCNYRREIQSCSECTSDVCTWNKVPEFCAEAFCSGLMTTTAETAAETTTTTTTTTTATDTTGPLGDTISVALPVVLAIAVITLGALYVRERRTRKKYQEWLKDKLLRETPDISQEYHQNQREIHRCEDKNVNDTSHGCNGKSKGVLDACDHKVFYRLMPSESSQMHTDPPYEQPERKPNIPVEETGAPAVHFVWMEENTELKMQPEPLGDSGIDSTSASSNGSLSVVVQRP